MGRKSKHRNIVNSKKKKWKLRRHRELKGKRKKRKIELNKKKPASSAKLSKGRFKSKKFTKTKKP